MTEHLESLDIEGSTAATEPEPNRQVKLITVHGTGAGDVSAQGDRWWQLGSTFLRELATRLNLDPANIEVVPYQWDVGPNSEMERRKAAIALYEELKACETSGTDYYVVGHSHGGSVIYTALLQSIAEDNPLEQLIGWCTVGTPFLDYRPNRWLFQRLGGMGLTFYASGMAAFFLSVCCQINLWYWGAEPNLESLRYVLAIYGMLCIGGLFLHERLRKKSWYSRKHKRRTAELYGDRWLGLWHLEDEAISALSNIEKVNAPIIPSNFLMPVVALAQLLTVAVLGYYAAKDIVFYDAVELLGLLMGSVDASAQEVVGAFNMAEMLGSLVGAIGALFLVVLAATYLLKFLAWMLGKPLSLVLNKVIWSSVRQRAWGDDLLKEDVKAVASHPPDFPQKFGPLPAPAADMLRGHSEKNAIFTLHKVRQILGMTRNSSHAPDVRAELAESLKWEELIHTSYFVVPEFLDLLALGLHRAGLAELQEGFAMTAEREQLAVWCEGSVDATERAM